MHINDALFSEILLHHDCSVSSDRQEQCSVLIELMRQFQTLKTSISSITESTEPLVDISSVLKDHEETRRSLTKVRLNCIFFKLKCHFELFPFFFIVHQMLS